MILNKTQANLLAEIVNMAIPSLHEKSDNKNSGMKGLVDFMRQNTWVKDEEIELIAHGTSFLQKYAPNLDDISYKGVDIETRTLFSLHWTLLNSMSDYEKEVDHEGMKLYVKKLMDKSEGVA